MSIDMESFRLVLAHQDDDGWFQRFRNLGFDLWATTEGSVLQSWGLQRYSNSFYCRVQDREKFLEALTELHGSEVVATALLELERG